jgi:DNA-binding transcriptional LysR family regulator
MSPIHVALHQMRSSLPPLPALLAFEAVARRGSFALAAGELNLTPSAISHQVARLEQLLGVRLFERSARGVQVTDAGEGYLKRVSGALGAIGAATDDVRKGVRNALYVHASPSFASLWLMPRLADFVSTHPGISLSLSASPTHSDFAVGQVDIDIRYGVPTWPRLVVQPVFDELVMPLASPAFLDRHRMETADDLLHVPLIQSIVNVVQWSDWFDHLGRAEVPDRFAFRFDRAYHALDAAVQGLGVALESSTIGAGHIAAGRLRPVLPDQRALAVRAHFLVYPQDHAQRPEVARFIEWLGRHAA